MNNSFRIIFIKINVIKADIIKIYTKNIYLITKESNNIRVYKIEVCIIIREYNFIKLSLTTETNQEQILMVKGKYQQLYHTFLGSYVYQGNILV